jgi:hypothetical protein
MGSLAAGVDQDERAQAAADSLNNIRKIMADRAVQAKWVARRDHTDAEISEFVASSKGLKDVLYSTPGPNDFREDVTAEDHLNNYRVHVEAKEEGVTLWNVDGGYQITVRGKFLDIHVDALAAIRFYDRVIAWKKAQPKTAADETGELPGPEGHYPDRHAASQEGGNGEPEAGLQASLKLSRVLAEAGEETPLSFEVDESAEAGGTSKKGQISTSYAALKSKFGPPPIQGHPFEDDVTSEWRFTDNEGSVYTVYDWRRTSFKANEVGPFEIGAAGGDVAAFTDWLTKQLAGA